MAGGPGGSCCNKAGSCCPPSNRAVSEAERPLLGGQPGSPCSEKQQSGEPAACWRCNCSCCTVAPDGTTVCQACICRERNTSDGSCTPQLQHPVLGAGSSSLTTSMVGVSDLHCDACTCSLKKVVRELPGVDYISVAVSTSSVQVRHDNRLVDTQRLIKAIADAGYAAELQSSQLRSSRVVKLQVGGMTCTACSGAVERALRAVPGVASAAVSLTLQEARAEYDPLLTSPEALAEAVDDVGYEAAVVGEADSGQLALVLGGMRCVECAAKVQAALRQVPGVIDAIVTLDANRAQVKYDPDETGPRDMIAAVEGIGFEARLPNPNDADSSADPTAVDQRLWWRRFTWSLVFSIPILSLTVVFPYIPATRHFLNTWVGGFYLIQLIKWALATPVQFTIGWPFHVGAFNALRHGTTNMNVLVSLGTNAAYIYSVIVVLLMRFSGEPHNPNYEPRDYFETGALLICFLSLGKYLESAARGRTSKAIQELLRLAPPVAVLVKQDANGHTVSEQELPTSLLHRADLVKILPGAAVPSDGQVVDGKSHIDESMITGESVPVAKRPGDSVIGGTLNGRGALLVRVGRVGADTTLAQIVALVEGAQMRKAPIQALADRISSYFVPAVVLLALATFLGWFIAGQAGGYPHSWLPQYTSDALFSVLFGISVLVIACPCAIGLATPTAVMVGTGVAATNGILIKGADAMERATKVDTVIFDKTGTLTEGRPSVVAHALFAAELVSWSEALHLAAAAEAGSEHPLAAAVLRYAAQELGPSETVVATTNPSVAGDGSAIELVPQRRAASSVASRTGSTSRRGGRGAVDVSWVRRAAELEVLEGRGVRCRVPPGGGWRGGAAGFDVTVTVGNRLLMEEAGVAVPTAAGAWLAEQEAQGRTCIMLAAAGQLAAALAITDPLKPEAHGVLAALHEMGIECWMVTGDNAATAGVIAQQLGLTRVAAQVLPAGKAAKVSELQHEGRVVAMVGDGINDSPALAQSDLGIAIGSGTDIAIEAADYVLMKSSLGDVLTALHLSRQTFARIRLNFMWAFGYNTCAIPIAAGALYPAIRKQMPPWVAGAAMALSSVSVVCSSLLLRYYKPPAPVLQQLLVEGAASRSNCRDAARSSFSKDLTAKEL